MNLTPQTIKLPHIDIAIEIQGDRDKPQLLLLHGWQDNLNSFHRLRHFLDDYCLILMDWPGHGLSGHRSPDNHYHFIDQVDDLVGVLQQEWINPVAVIGHSMGAAVLSIVSAAFPELVAKAIFIDMLGPLSIKESDVKEQLRKSIIRYQRVNLLESKTFESIDAAVARRQQASPMSYDDVKPIVERNLRATKEGWVWCTDPRLKIPSKTRLSESQVIALLKDIKAEVLLIACSESLNKNAMNMQQRLEAIEKFAVEVVDGGHHIHIEQPQIVSDLIKKFLKEQQTLIIPE